MKIDLHGQRAVVTGGTRGIGAAIVRQLAEAGAEVVTAGRTDPGSLPPRVRFVRADVATAEGVAALARRSLELLDGGSGAARLARPQSLAYTAAKAALTAYSKGLSKEVGSHGVRVNVVHPGVIRTDRLDRRLADVARESGRPEGAVLGDMVEEFGIPLGRIGTADELAAVILFLVSPGGSYTSGSQVTVDGGAMPTV